MKNFFKTFLCFILIITCCLCFASCKKTNNEPENFNPFGDDYYNTIGGGRQSLFFYFVDPVANRQNFLIATDAVFLLDAFRENNMITSESGEKITIFAGVVANEENGYRWVLYADGKKVEGNYEEVKIDTTITYSLIAERIDL